MKIEVWRDVPGYKNYYQVSNQGRIRSLDRWVIFNDGRKRFYKGRIMEGNDNGGYKKLTLSKDDKQRIYNISQLVAMAFLDHEPNGHILVVDHINGIKTDNRIENLQIVTNRQNLSTCYRTNEDSFTSEYVGVSYYKQANKWEAYITFKGKQIGLGYFENELEASDAYQKALSKVNDGTFNPENYKPSFTSKFKGVAFHKNRQKWQANPYINGKRIYLGYHSTEEEAHQAILEYEAIQPILI